MKGKIKSRARRDSSVFHFLLHFIFFRGFLLNFPNRVCHDRIQNSQSLWQKQERNFN